MSHTSESAACPAVSAVGTESSPGHCSDARAEGQARTSSTNAASVAVSRRTGNRLSGGIPDPIHGNPPEPGATDLRNRGSPEADRQSAVAGEAARARKLLAVDVRHVGGCVRKLDAHVARAIAQLQLHVSDDAAA